MKNITLLLLSLCFVAACGDDEGLNPNTKLIDISDDEAQILCDFQEDRVDPVDRHKVMCFGDARIAADADPSISCEDRARDCIDNTEVFAEDCSMTTVANSGFAACTEVPIVRDLTECLVADGVWFSDLAERVTCDNVALESAFLPEDCELIASECPEFFGGEE